MTRTWLKILLVAAPLTAGCLHKDTRHSLYLEPDGRVSWVVIEADVHSDEEDAAKRRAEEDAYLVAAEDGSHDVGRGFSALEPRWMQTIVVRRTRPFVVVTEARFDRIDRVFEAMLRDIGAPGFASLTAEGRRHTFRLRLDVSALDWRDVKGEASSLFDLDRYRFVLTGGRFVSASGFDLDGESTATPAALSDERLAAAGGIVDLVLTWESAPTSGRRTSSDRSSR